MSETPETDATWEACCCSGQSWYRIAETMRAKAKEFEPWRECAELLAELAEYRGYVGDYLSLRARAMGEFRKLKEGGK